MRASPNVYRKSQLKLFALLRLFLFRFRPLRCSVVGLFLLAGNKERFPFGAEQSPGRGSVKCSLHNFISLQTEISIENADEDTHYDNLDKYGDTH